MTLARHLTEFISVDLFAGGGGASEGIRRATGTCPVLAVNHSPAAIEMHKRNHPRTFHLCESVWDVDPKEYGATERIDLLWASPDCKHFSKAKGGKPKDSGIRGLAWVVIDWARETRPSVIALENVAELKTWGPLDEEGQPIPERAGETWRAFLQAFRDLGYTVEHRVLDAANYGSPTHRRRLFLVARCDGKPIAWPAPTHGPGRPSRYRTYADCADWTLPTRSIFNRKKPLAEKTMARIAHGLVKYVIEADEPYVVSIDGETATPWIISTRNGERKGQAPRTRDVHRPFGTVTAQGSQNAVVCAWLAKHYGGVVGHGVDRPLGTITATDHHALCEAEIARVSGNNARHIMPFLTSYYGTGIGQRVTAPLRTITTRDRFGLINVLVEIDGERWVITDIRMRMLQPRELARCQGFPDSYVLTGNKREQVARIGNSVCPQAAEAVVRAQFPGLPTVGQIELFGGDR